MLGTDGITQTQLDANALAVLDTLREEGSATGATARLRINAFAMSRSLGPGRSSARPGSDAGAYRSHDDLNALANAAHQTSRAPLLVSTSPRRVVATTLKQTAGEQFARDSGILISAPQRQTRSVAADVGLAVLPSCTNRRRHPYTTRGVSDTTPPMPIDGLILPATGAAAGWLP